MSNEKTRALTASLRHIGKVLPWVLIIAGIIGLIASGVITQEKLSLAQNPHYQPICDLNPIISCGSVMKSQQSHVFGFSNTYIGLVGFPIIITAGVAMITDARFKRWWWLGMQAGLTFGILFAYWLLFESIYRIHALCPWCLSVDVAITTAWWYQTLYNFYHGNLRLPVRFRRAGSYIKRHHADLLISWFILVTLIILQHFWYYFGHHL